MDQELQKKLTRVGPNTPMGTLLRCYWHPVAATCELPAGSTKRVRLLAEDLVLFRTAEEQLGLLEEACPHRRASLAYGHMDGETIACPYHGWKFDTSGNCLEMPAEQSDPELLKRCKAVAYKAEELGGLIFAYLGPHPAPLLPRYDLLVWDGVLRDIGQARLPCNWLQIMENSVDPTHVEWLHGHHLAGVRQKNNQSASSHYRKKHIKIGFERFRYGIVKRRVLEDGDKQDDDWAVGHPLIFPLMVRVGAQTQHRLQIRVPVDDTHTHHYWYSCYRLDPSIALPPQDKIPLYDVPWQDEKGEFITDFVDGGDIMVWLTQGTIADRTREHLVASDKGIALYRQMLKEEIEQALSGKDPLGVIRDPEENRLIELPQEKNKYSGGIEFLKEVIEISHVRYSPLKAQILSLLGNSE